MGLTILFIHLKIILLQYFQFSVFSFQFSATISSIQTDPMCSLRKNILYQMILCYYSVFSFQFSAIISSIQTHPKFLSCSLRDISFYHIRRQKNFVALRLARRAICSPFLVWVELVLPNIFDVYNYDLCLINEQYLPILGASSQKKV